MGRQVRAGFLGPPRVLSSMATSEGPFVRPFIQKSGCDCMGTKSLRALTSHPCLWLSRERVSQAPLRKRGDSDLLLLGPRPVHSSRLHWLPCPRGPAIHTGHHLPVPPVLTSGHTQQAVPALNAGGDSRKMQLAPFTCRKVFLEGLLTYRQLRMHWVWASPRSSWKVG